jgi:hypothetical protein
LFAGEFRSEDDPVGKVDVIEDSVELVVDFSVVSAKRLSSEGVL